MASEHLTRLLRALAKKPDLFMEVKVAMVDALVAREWVSFNGSEYAKKHNISFPPGCMARFTPARQGEELVVVKVYRRIKQREPNRGDYEDRDDEGQYEKDHKAWEADCNSMGFMPWKWALDSDGKRMSAKTGDLVEGPATTAADAMAQADRYLERRGWVLVDSKAGDS